MGHYPIPSSRANQVQVCIKFDPPPIASFASLVQYCCLHFPNAYKLIRKLKKDAKTCNLKAALKLGMFKHL